MSGNQKQTREGDLDVTRLIRTLASAVRLILTSAIVVGLLVTVVTPSKVYAASLVVDRFDDNASASACTGVPNDCSLRGAVTKANTVPGIDTVVLSAGTYTLTITGSNEDNNATGDLDVRDHLIVLGTTAATTIINGGEIDRVIQVMNGIGAELRMVTIRNGKSINSDGGGVSNLGILAVADSIISDNSAISDEPATVYVGGGAVNNLGILTIENSSFTNNTATTYGGVFANHGGIITITSSTFSGNSTADGGFIDNFAGGTLIISNSSFVDNTATGNGPSCCGGGVILNESNDGIDSTVTISNSTFLGNSASVANDRSGGVIFNIGAITIVNSTFSDNSAGHSGGAIFNAGNGSVSVTNATFSNNRADDDGGTISNSHTFVITNSIVASNVPASNCSGTITNGGHNLDTGTTCGWGSSNGSMSNTDPHLGPLANNGGETQTHALSAESPAVDAGGQDFCPSIDQRGIKRPIDGNNDGSTICDIGAFEREDFVYLPIIIR